MKKNDMGKCEGDNTPSAIKAFFGINMSKMKILVSSMIYW
jgi:hypothetical protein